MATLTAAVCMLFLLAKTMTTAMGEFIVYCLSACESPTGGTELLREIEQQASWILAKTVLPIMLVTGFCAVAVTLAQTKFLVSGELLRPKFSRISPKQGIKRLFSLKSVIDAVSYTHLDHGGPAADYRGNRADSEKGAGNPGLFQGVSCCAG